MGGNKDFIEILRSIRGSAAPGETATDGIWYELTIADIDGNPGIYGDILAKYGVVVDNTATLDQAVAIIDGLTVVANELTEGSSPTAQLVGTTLTLGIPKGTTGQIGATGATGPRGLTGLTGAKGDTGAQGIQGVQGVKGDTGDIGPANTLIVGTVSSGGSPSASITGVSPNQILNLVLQQGPQGLQGIQGLKGDVGDDGRGIVSVVKTSGTGAAGTTDVYTITYTDASQSSFNVYNGADGLGNGDMLKSAYDSTNNGKVDVAEVADKWTTGRTLTIGSTGKSVDGSDNVSWSLAEIGAQAAGSYQPLDATLTAIASVTTAADKVIYATGADTFATTTVSAFARTVLDDADAATVRTTIGAQALDADLTAIAALAGTSGLLKKTAADTWVLDTAAYTTNLGTVTGVTGTGPIVSSGGTAPAISISAATTSAAGSMSAADKTKLDGVATSANNYAHPNGDGNLHVPATGTANSGKVLTAGATAGSLSWTTVSSGTTDHALLTNIGTNTHTQIDTALTRLTNTSGTNTGDQTTVSGNAGTATKLQTARTIGGVSFDGTDNINLPGVNTTGNQNTTGNAATATKLTSSFGDWSASGAIGNVVGMLAWKNYGNGHAIFDASNGTSPTGLVVNNTNPNTPWSPTYPTIMGWNGAQTYGVRVDSARVADSATTATTASNSNKLIGMNWYWSGQSGQPGWLWGGSDGANMYVYNPANFRVDSARVADSAGNATKWNGATMYTSTSAASGGNDGDIWFQY